jgi:hypothetical protein
LPAARKHSNVAAGNHKVSLIIDDVESIQPWKPRQIRVHGVAEAVGRAGRFGEKEYLAITLTVSWSIASRRMPTTSPARLRRRRLFSQNERGFRPRYPSFRSTREAGAL